MAGILVDADLCRGCGLCERACATAGIAVSDGVARVTDGCVMCGACVEACPFGALSLDRGPSEAGASPDGEGASGVWVVAQVDAAGALLPVALELTGRARELADARSCRVAALLPEGPDAPRANAAELARAGADEVLVCRDARMDPVDPALCAAWVADLARSRRPEIVLFGATALGREIAPGVAVRLGTGLTADCTRLEIDPATGLLEQTRPAFGGNLMATITCPGRRPQMATVRPGVLAVPAPDPARPVSVEEVPLDPAARPGRRVLSVEREDAAPTVAGARRLVVVGRGIGSKKNLPLMRRLAELLDAELGCTRPLVEAGWLEYPRQVGQTGASVAPELLVSVGVSGAVQHLAGIGGADTVIAVNEDPAAPIFDVADWRVVGDCIEVVRELVAELERRAGS